MIVGQAGPQRLILPIMRMLGVQDITIGENPGDDRRVVLLPILIGPIDDVAGADIALRQLLGPMAHEKVMLRIRASPGMTVDPRDIFPRPVRLYGRPEVVGPGVAIEDIEDGDSSFSLEAGIFQPSGHEIRAVVLHGIDVFVIPVVLGVLEQFQFVVAEFCWARELSADLVGESLHAGHLERHGIHIHLLLPHRERVPPLLLLLLGAVQRHTRQDLPQRGLGSQIQGLAFLLMPLYIRLVDMTIPGDVQLGHPCIPEGPGGLLIDPCRIGQDVLDLDLDASDGREEVWTMGTLVPTQRSTYPSSVTGSP